MAAPSDGEAERVEEGRGGVRLTTGEDRHRAPQRRHLGERQVHEDHLARDHVQSEIGVDRHDDETGHQRWQEQAQIHHEAPLVRATSL